MKQIIATGSIHGGYSFIGPFLDLPEALRFAEANLKGNWSVLNLHNPEESVSVRPTDAG